MVPVPEPEVIPEPEPLPEPIPIVERLVRSRGKTPVTTRARSSQHHKVRTTQDMGGGRWGGPTRARGPIDPGGPRSTAQWTSRALVCGEMLLCF